MKSKSNCPHRAPHPLRYAATPTEASVRRVDWHFRKMRAALNASEGGCADRMFAGGRVRWEVHRLRSRLRQLGVGETALPPPRKAFVRSTVPKKITDVAWHEQLRLWWWPRGFSPNIHP